jgi:putative phosphoesterase
MRVAALYDIHGNLPALEAVLEEVRRERVDRVVVGGDVLPGPMPRETLARLLDLPVPTDFLRGNGDRVTLEAMDGGDISEVPEPYRDGVRWGARQLAPEHRELLAGWRSTVHLEIAGLGEVLFCHATPRSDDEPFTRLTPEELLVPIFEGLGVSLVVCGHTHMQFDRRIGAVRVVNAGSVGMPFGEPGADWLLLGPGVELRHTAYDLVAAAERIRTSELPRAEDFAMNNVLRPPPEQETLEAFTRLSLSRAPPAPRSST